MPTPDINRLRSLVETGYASEEEQAQYRRLVEQQDNSQAPVVGSARLVPPVTEEDEYYVPVNAESFEQGGAGFTPPPDEGVYPGICTGAMVPNNARDQFWFNFSSLDGSEPRWMGSLVTAALTSQERSGAFKVKDILLALEVDYNLTGNGVEFRGIKGRLCQCDWQYVDIGGQRQLRIQNVYKASQNIEGL